MKIIIVFAVISLFARIEVMPQAVSVPLKLKLILSNSVHNFSFVKQTVKCNQRGDSCENGNPCCAGAGICKPQDYDQPALCVRTLIYFWKMLTVEKNKVISLLITDNMIKCSNLQLCVNDGWFASCSQHAECCNQYCNTRGYCGVSLL